MLPLIKSGDLRALAKLDGRPFQQLPDLPTFTAVTGVDLGDVAVWLGLVAPHGTPQPIINKLAVEVAKILADPQVKARTDAAGIDPVSSTPAEFAAFIKREAARWPSVVKSSGMHFD